MNCKGIERGKPIEYDMPPKQIVVEKRGQYCVCDNCAGYGEQMCYVVHLNKTDFASPNGVICKNRYAKPKELWLCEDCLKELKQAIEEAL